jgi:Na+-driven multidrug efflux pump
MLPGFRIIAVSVLFTGINVFASGFFTALNNGKVSALISMLRTFLLEAGALILLPKHFGLAGVWWAMPVAEILAILVAGFMLVKYKKEYGY